MLLTKPTAECLPQPRVLRVALNLANRALVRVVDPDGLKPRFKGIAPAIAHEIANQLGTGVTMVPFANVETLTQTVESDIWDIAFIGSDPARNDTMRFTSSYAEIPVTGLVRRDSLLTSVDDVDRPAVRLVSVARSAFDLWFERNLLHSELIRGESPGHALSLFRQGSADVLGGLQQQLYLDMNRVSGLRMLTGSFTTIQQSIATSVKSPDLANLMEEFVCSAINAGVIREIIARNPKSGLSPV